MAFDANRGGDPLKDYWWLLLVAVLFVGGWLSMSSPASTGADDVRLVARQDNAAEQSLRSLDGAENPQGAPGVAVDMPGSAKRGSAGADAGAGSGQAGSLYQVPGGASGSPIPEGAGDMIAAAANAQNSGGGTSLADALRGVAASVTKAPDNGWGGAAARSGLTKPKAEFGQVGSSRMGGGGSTSASLVVVDKAFGTGGNPGLNLNPGAGGLPAAKGRIAAAMQGGPGLDGLKSARQTSLDALMKGDEMAARKGGQSFDGSAAAKSAMGQLRASGAGAGVSDGDSVPMNLKANDPSKINQKEIEPPPLADTKEQKDPGNDEYIKQQMMMMMLGIAMTGILGPAMGGMGAMMFQGLGGTTPPPNGGSHSIAANSK